MSRASQTITTLLRLGATIEDAFNEDDASGTLTEFLESPEFEQIRAAVDDLLARLEDSDLEDAIESLGEKRRDIRLGRPLAELSADELADYMALGRARLALSRERVARTNEFEFVRWVTDEVLPVILPIVGQISKLVL
jgi:DNA-directed RNA polymerase specialized sigma24 family protein